MGLTGTPGQISPLRVRHAGCQSLGDRYLTPGGRTSGCTLVSLTITTELMPTNLHAIRHSGHLPAVPGGTSVCRCMQSHVLMSIYYRTNLNLCDQLQFTRCSVDNICFMQNSKAGVGCLCIWPWANLPRGVKGCVSHHPQVLHKDKQWVRLVSTSGRAREQAAHLPSPQPWATLPRRGLPRASPEPAGSAEWTCRRPAQGARREASAACGAGLGEASDSDPARIQGAVTSRGGCPEKRGSRKSCQPPGAQVPSDDLMPRGLHLDPRLSLELGPGQGEIPPGSWPLCSPWAPGPLPGGAASPSCTFTWVGAGRGTARKFRAPGVCAPWARETPPTVQSPTHRPSPKPGAKM